MTENKQIIECNDCTNINGRITIECGTYKAVFNIDSNANCKVEFDPSIKLDNNAPEAYFVKNISGAIFDYLRGEQ